MQISKATVQLNEYRYRLNYLDIEEQIDCVLAKVKQDLEEVSAQV